MRGKKCEGKRHKTKYFKQYEVVQSFFFFSLNQKTFIQIQTFECERRDLYLLTKLILWKLINLFQVGVI